MKKVLFFIDPDWVFGKIHNELIKALYPDFYCDLKSWSVSMTHEEADLFKDKYDLFVSTPQGCFVLHDNYQVPFNKLIGVLHAEYDIYSCFETIKDFRDKFEALGGYAAIWPYGQNVSIGHGIKNIPKVLPLGLFTDLYEIQNPAQIKTCGFFGKLERLDRGIDIKRGELAKAITAKTNIHLKQCSSFSFLVADQLYKNVDFVIFTSLMEGNPYPALEAFASGIPVIGTRTGVFAEYASNGSGVILPFEQEQFVEGAIQTINTWISNPTVYYRACEAALEIRAKLDWSNMRLNWIEFFNAVLAKQ